MKKLLHDKNFLNSVYTLATPIIIQNFIMSALGALDVLMVGHLGEIALASVGMANQFLFVLNWFLIGLAGAVSIFAAQYWGKKDLNGIKLSFMTSLVVCSFISLLFTLAAVIFPKVIMGLYSSNAAVVQLSSKFLQILGISFIPLAFSCCLAAVLRGTGDTKKPTITNVIALATNTLLNFLLINGNLGFPKMGVLGAAVATLVARILELSLLIIFVYYGKSFTVLQLNQWPRLNFAFVKNFLKIAVPSIMGLVFWSIGINVYNMVYLRVGTNSYAAVSIVGPVEQLAFVIFGGISMAAGIMIGNSIGQNNRELVIQYAKFFRMVHIVLGIAMGGLMIAGGYFMLTLYNVSKATHEIAFNVLIVLGCIFWVKVSNMIYMNSMLEAGGDTRYKFALNTMAMWVFGVPLVYLGAVVFKLPIHWVVLLTLGEEASKLIGAHFRYRSQKWIRNITNSAQDNLTNQQEVTYEAS